MAPSLNCDCDGHRRGFFTGLLGLGAAAALPGCASAPAASVKPTCGVVTLSIEVATPALAMSSRVFDKVQFLTIGGACPTLSSSAT